MTDFEPKPAFDPKAVAVALIRQARTGALATLRAGAGDPYASLVDVATMPSGAPLLLISQLAVHTRNILADPRVSLMLDERTADDPLQAGRVSIAGVARRTESPTARRRYLAAHPGAALFVDFADFGFYEVEPAGAHLVAGFGRIVDLAPADLLTDVSGAQPLLDAEEGAIAHMNADHADALRLYATALLGAPDGEWVCVGCDPDGLDLQSGRIARRLPFSQRVTSPGGLRAVLVQLAERARAG